MPEQLRDAVVATQQTRRMAQSPEAVADHLRAVALAKTWWAQHPAPRPTLMTATLPTRIPAATSWPTAPCESCHAPIIWCTTDRGDRVCVDADSVRAASGSADCLVSARGPGHPPRVVLIRSQAELFGRRTGYRTHLSTCPHSNRYRDEARRGRRRSR